MDDFRYIPEEIERPEKFREEEKEAEVINLNTGPLRREDFESLRKQIEDWPITPGRQPTYEIKDGIAHITNEVGFRMMMSEADFREHFMGEDDDRSDQS